ncbi:MAG: HlyC/CorC family transporter [Candidatus Didemnitutus sp.]|nr:HlyC/CorC family transporter [Candidatus Didemnitutus sp.]
MLVFLLAVALTLLVSFLCSMTEALILSSTTAEIEALKRSHPKRGALLDRFRHNLDSTISTILTLNTIANTLGATVIGALGTRLFGDAALGLISAALTLAILIFSEVIPKNLGVVYRAALQPHVVFPLLTAQRVLTPIIWVCQQVVRFVIRRKADQQAADREIILLAEKGAQEGTLSRNESSIITNALSLDDVRVSEIMTPRVVVTTLPRNATVGEIFRDHPNIPFARLPVYGKNLDDIVGLVRRRDLLKAKANDQDSELVEKLMQEVQFVPETVTVEQALLQFLKTHQQIAVVVDEFGSTCGVVSMEDIMEHILGREIFEKDDVAVDMREFARSKSQKLARSRKSAGDTKPPLPTGN